MTVKNAAPKRYRAYYIEPGLADYSDLDLGMVLIQKPALDKMMDSYIGKPVWNMSHRTTDEVEAFDFANQDPKDLADGIIAATGYDPESGWYWQDILVWDQETQDTIDLKDRNGNPIYSASCAYTPTKEIGGGSYHGIEYQAEVIDGRGDHLAIVPNPRYEGAKIYANSKKSKEDFEVKITLFKKKTNEAPPEPEKKEPEKDEEALENMDGVVEMENGEQVPLSELVKMYKEKGSSEPEGTVYNMDDEVDIDGERMPIRELVARCGYKSNMENADPPTDTPAEEVVDESKQATNSKTQKPNENFNKIKNAAEKDAAPIKPNFETKAERLQRGHERYSIPGKIGGTK
jgi:hypothetical protein